MLRRTWSGDTAREARLKSGLKVDEVAEATKTHRATVYGWEAGREPQMRHALALADLYRVSIDSLFVHDEDADTPATAGEESQNNHEPGTAAVEGSAGLARTGG